MTHVISVLQQKSFPQPQVNFMNLETFAEWLLCQGHQIIHTPSSYWFDAGPRVFQAFPYHWIINPSEEEIIEMFKKNRLIALKYSTSLSSSIGQVSYHVIYEKTSYELSSLCKKARHDVIKGLEHVCCEPISMSRLAFDGWELRYETLVRQGRQNAETRESWEKMCICAEGLPGFEAWGAIYNGELVAALLSYTLDDTVSILYQQSKTDHMKFGVNNALTYSFSHTLLQRPEIGNIFYGLHSLDAPPTVDKYKFRMGFSAKPLRQRVIFNPILNPFINSLSLSLLNCMKIFWPNNSKLSNAEGMIRFFISGNKSLLHQNWPEGLNKQRDAFLANETTIFT